MQPAVARDIATSVQEKWRGFNNRNNGWHCEWKLELIECILNLLRERKLERRERRFKLVAHRTQNPALVASESNLMYNRLLTSTKYVHII